MFAIAGIRGLEKPAPGPEYFSSEMGPEYKTKPSGTVPV
jgi:hypothetical protein